VTLQQVSVVLCTISKSNTKDELSSGSDLRSSSAHARRNAAIALVDRSTSVTKAFSQLFASTHLN